jgi:hypothetical protein
MMESASTSEMLIIFYQTTRFNSPENNHIYSCRRENLKPQLTVITIMTAIVGENLCIRGALEVKGKGMRVVVGGGGAAGG